MANEKNLCKAGYLTEIFLFLIEELINESYCFILLLVYNLSVYLGGGDVCMPQ